VAAANERRTAATPARAAASCRRRFAQEGVEGLTGLPRARHRIGDDREGDREEFAHRAVRLRAEDRTDLEEAARVGVHREVEREGAGEAGDERSAEVRLLGGQRVVHRDQGGLVGAERAFEFRGVAERVVAAPP
jgi:hypothetical protein